MAYSTGSMGALQIQGEQVSFSATDGLRLDGFLAGRRKAGLCIIYDHTKTVTPLKDELSRPFFDSTNRIPLSIMKGNSCAESVERARKAYDEWIVKVRSLVIDEHLPEQEWLLRALIWDCVSLKLLGNGDSTI